MKTFSDLMILMENEDLENHPFKFTEMYKERIIKFIEKEAAKHQPAFDEALQRLKSAQASGNPENIRKAQTWLRLVGGTKKGFSDLIQKARNIHPSSEDLDSVRQSMIQAVTEVEQEYGASSYKDIRDFLTRVPLDIITLHKQASQNMTPQQRQRKAAEQQRYRMQQQSGQQ